MKKSKLNKKKCQQILATLVMGMNFVNSMAPMGLAMQSISENVEKYPNINIEAEPLNYVILPHTLEFLEGIVFSKAEAVKYSGNDIVSSMGTMDSQDVSSSEYGSVCIMKGGMQRVHSSGIGMIDVAYKGNQVVFTGGTGIINILSGGSQRVDGAHGIINRMDAGGQIIQLSGGSGYIDTMNSGGQNILNGAVGVIGTMNFGSQNIQNGVGHINTMCSGNQNISNMGTGVVDTLIDGEQYILGESTGIVSVMRGGTQRVYKNATGKIESMAGGRQIVDQEANGLIDIMNSGLQDIYHGAIGTIVRMNDGLQVVSNGVGTVEKMNGGLQWIAQGGSGTVSTMNGGIQIIEKGIGTISAMSGGEQAILSGGSGTVSTMMNDARQAISSGGISLDTNLYGGIQMVYDGGTAKDTTINGGTAVMLGAGAVVENVKMTGGEYRLNADGKAYRVEGKFDFSGGNFDMTQDLYGNKTGTYETLGINDLQTGGGTFIMDTDLASEIDGDKIVLDNAAAGTSYIQVNDASLINGPVEGHKNLLLVTVNNGTAAFAGKELNNGGLWTVTPTIENGVNVTDAAGNVIGTADQWYLTHVVRAVNKDTQVLLDGADSSYALWRNTNDTLRKRLGDLRYRSNKTDGDGIWARYTGGKFGSGSFDGSYNMYQLGYDKADNAKSTYGIAVESGTGRGDYDFGSSKDKIWSGSLYGTWYGDNGSYTDVVARIGQMDTDMKSYGDYPDKATAKSHVYSLSVEYGKTIELSKKAGTFIEPQAQFIVGRLGSSSYTTDRGNNVYLGGVNSYIGRIGFTAGQKTPDGNDVYFKASLLHEFGGSRDMHMKAANGETMSASREYGDSWFEVGLGTNIHLSKASYFYGDIERSFGGDIEKKWQINAGVRFAF